MARKNKKILLFCILIVFLYGCEDKKELVFHDIEYLNVDTALNTCTLVKEVHGVKVNAFNYDGDKIIIKDDIVVCPSIDTSLIGKITLKFELNGEVYTYTLTIIDNIPPVIDFDGTEVFVDVGIAKQELINKFKVSDKHSGVKTEVIGQCDLNSEGTYDVVISAIDDSDNKTEKKVTVIVANKESKVEVDKEVEKPNSESSVQNDKKETIDSLPQDSKPSNDDYILYAQEKTFLFSEGYDYNSCYDACVSYAEEMIRLNKARGYTCTPIRNDKQEYIGYRVSFK